MNRQKKIFKISLVNIVTNIFLVIFKLIVGIFSKSISIIMDALNNLSDILSAVISILGAFLSGKKPDKRHPYGYGKLEYITSLIIAIIIFITGISSIYESIKKIVNPIIGSYSIISIIIITASIFTKLFLSKYINKEGKKLNSSMLIATGKDAFFDSIITSTTLINAITCFFFKLSIDGFIGLFISVLIIKSAISIIIESFDNIIGTRIDESLSKNIKKIINSYEEVHGTYDLILHEYGPEKIIGSVHIEIDDNIKAKDIHNLTRRITEDIYSKFGVILTIGIYASNTSNDEYLNIKNDIIKLIKTYKSIIQWHGYYVDSDRKLISFDLIFRYNESSVEKTKNEIIEKLNKLYPHYTFKIIIDNNYTD